MSTEAETIETAAPHMAQSKDMAKLREKLVNAFAERDAAQEQADEDSVQRQLGQTAEEPAETPQATQQAEQKQPEAPKPDPLAEERAKLEADRAELERQRRAFDEHATAAKRELQNQEQQIEQLERFAKDWDESGDKALAERARAQAAKLKVDVNAAKTEVQRAEFRRAQDAVLQAVVKDFPELSKPDSTMTKEMDALLKSRPVLLTYPEGLRDAAQTVDAKLRGSKASQLEKENQELKSQLDKVQRRLQPATGSTASPRGNDAPFQSLPPEQQRARLLARMRRDESF
jgi:chromosome segregation ATPase